VENEKFRTVKIEYLWNHAVSRETDRVVF